jgi:hypothetical protein
MQRRARAKTKSALPAVCCAICLERPKNQTTLDGCAHVYCFDCIKSWSRLNNVCPLCKSKFHKLQNRRTKMQVGTPPSSESSDYSSSSSDWDPRSYQYETYKVEGSATSSPESDPSSESSPSSVPLEEDD